VGQLKCTAEETLGVGSILGATLGLSDMLSGEGQLQMLCVAFRLCGWLGRARKRDARRRMIGRNPNE
jgi:hypothetical protein